MCQFKWKVKVQINWPVEVFMSLIVLCGFDDDDWFCFLSYIGLSTMTTKLIYNAPSYEMVFFLHPLLCSSPWFLLYLCSVEVSYSKIIIFGLLLWIPMFPLLFPDPLIIYPAYLVLPIIIFGRHSFLIGSESRALGNLFTNVRARATVLQVCHPTRKSQWQFYKLKLMIPSCSLFCPSANINKYK